MSRAHVLPTDVSLPEPVYLGLTGTLRWFVDTCASFLVVGVFAPYVALRPAKKLLLVIAVLEIPLQLDSYLGFQEKAAAQNALPGLNVSLMTVCLLVLCILALLDFLARFDRPRRGWLNPASLPLATYLMIVGLSTLIAHDANLALFEFLLLAQAFILHLYVIAAIKTRQDALFIGKCLVVGLLLQGIVMVGLYGIGKSVTVASITARVDPNGRVAGTPGSPNTAGSYLCLLLPAAFSLIVTPIGQLHRFLAGSAFTFGLIGLILTRSRGAWLGFGLAVVVLCWLLWRSGKLRINVKAVCAAAMLILALFGDVILRRLDTEGGAAYARVPLYELALDIIQDQPVLGVGANNFAAVMSRYVMLDMAGQWISTVHNKYLLVWAETGALGLLTFLWALGAILQCGWRCWKRADPLLSPLALGFTAGILGQMAHMCVALFHGRLQVQMLWLVSGLVVVLDAITKESTGVSAKSGTRGSSSQQSMKGEVKPKPPVRTVQVWGREGRLIQKTR